MRNRTSVAAIGVLITIASSVWAADEVKSFWGPAGNGHAKIKRWLYTELAGPMSEKGFEQAPVLTFWAGWDFTDEQWKLNEYTNQMGHTLVGALSTSLFGRMSTFGIALGTEIEQYLTQDRRQLKFADRVRDVLFYLIA